MKRVMLMGAMLLAGPAARAAEPGDPCPKQADAMVAAMKAAGEAMVAASHAFAELQRCSKSARAWVGLCDDAQKAADKANAAFAAATENAKKSKDDYFACRNRSGSGSRPARALGLMLLGMLPPPVGTDYYIVARTRFTEGNVAGVEDVDMREQYIAETSLEEDMLVASGGFTFVGDERTCFWASAGADWIRIAMDSSVTGDGLQRLLDLVAGRTPSAVTTPDAFGQRSHVACLEAELFRANGMIRRSCKPDGNLKRARGWLVAHNHEIQIEVDKLGQKRLAAESKHRAILRMQQTANLGGYLPSVAPLSGLDGALTPKQAAGATVVSAILLLAPEVALWAIAHPDVLDQSARDVLAH